MLFALALYASTAHAGIPAYSVERPAPSTRTRRTTTSSCWGVKARMARGENLPSTRPSSSPPRRGTGHRRGRGTCRSTPARSPAGFDQAALTSIVLGVAACGAGTLTSSTPFAYFASTWAASTPSGRAKSRWNAPYATSRMK
jgi:hypothetical protein